MMRYEYDTNLVLVHTLTSCTLPNIAKRGSHYLVVSHSGFAVYSCRRPIPMDLWRNVDVKGNEVPEN